MQMISRRSLLAATTALIAFASHGVASAEDLKLTIAYQTVVEPSKIPQADGVYEKTLGAAIDWRKFEALVSRNGSGVEKVADLAGKKVAVPFVSTTHYSLLAALKHEGVDPKSVEILNLRPPEIAAAWERGDIDAAYVWDPALGQIKTSGKVVTDSAQVAAWGAPTFDAWIVRTDFAEKHPEAVRDFVKVTGASYADFLANPGAWSSSSEQAGKIARLTGAKVEDIPVLLKGYVFPTLAEQASDKFLGGETVKAVTATSEFLKEQGKIDAVLPDYSKYVTAKYVTDALASN
ncbi:MULTISPECIES: taurine ABC transporter substrate-binding protein [unclassified Mesorhizobium]|uniref:taurine ABC transporter substrate-binding protein n=1 Tax=unclassified Mesorhizobium TaxID=325217 RepID=UPI0030145570